MNSELLTKPKYKEEQYKMWKQGQVHQEEYRGTMQVYRDEAGKAIAHLKLNLVEDMKNNKKAFYRSITSKMKTRKNVILLLNWMRNLMIKHKEKTYIFTISLPQSFLVRSDLGILRSMSPV